MTAEADWGWEAYERPAGVPASRLTIARACFAGVERSLAQRSLGWLPSFHSWYIGFYRAGGYDTLKIDLRTPVPIVAVKLPDPPGTLGLESPYPDLQQIWDAVHRHWGWFVPSVDAAPDLGAAIDLSRPYQPESGPMRPPRRPRAE